MRKHTFGLDSHEREDASFEKVSIRRRTQRKIAMKIALLPNTQALELRAINIQQPISPNHWCWFCIPIVVWYATLCITYWLANHINMQVYDESYDASNNSYLNAT